MRRLEPPGNPGADNTAARTEFPLRVAVCAWCKPRERGTTLGAMSHGICLRHFREMRSKLQSSLPGRGDESVRPQVSRSRGRGRSTRDIAQLSFPFPATFAAASPLSA